MVKIIESEYKYGVLIRFDGVNGSIYDAIEYSYVLSKIDKTRLIICNNSNIDDTVLYNLFLDLISKKYILKDLPFDVLIIKYGIIHYVKYKSLIFMDTNIMLRLSMFFADKYILLNDYLTNAFKNRLSILSLPNVYVFNEMPYFPSPINYKFKFAFDIYKKYDKLENNTLISYKDLNRQNNQHIMKLFSNDTGEEIKFNEYPINNFHSRFNKYIYNNINFFDPRCRLVIECFYYGITLDNIIRNIKKENYDGAYYRLKDLKENGLEGRYLDINDEAIQVMIE